MHWLNNLVVSIERACSPQKALDFADKFNAQVLLCRLVLELGSNYYEYIYRNVD